MNGPVAGPARVLERRRLMRAQTTVWTIGHWTCPEEIFVDLLGGEGIEVVADVRSHPGSRTSPQFNQEAMRGWLERAGIDYVHLPALGGRRGKQDVDPGVNAGWRQPSFKNYADYTLTAQYGAGIRQLTDLAESRRAAYLCAEPMPWRCHRLIISNTLTARGMTVRHIMAGRDIRIHRLGMWGATPVVQPDGTISYPPGA